MIERRDYNMAERNELQELCFRVLAAERIQDPDGVLSFLMRTQGHSRKLVAILTGCEKRPETVSNRVARIKKKLLQSPRLKDFF